MALEIVLKVKTMYNIYNRIIINEIKAIEGYALRKAYGRYDSALDICDAIVAVSKRAITEIENATREVPRCKKFFYLQSHGGNKPSVSDTPQLEEFWRQVRKEVDRQRSLK